MRGGEDPAPSSLAGFYGGAGGERGAGGKLRRDRKPPSTPYDRPHRGWISRIVTPAKRLISGGATRLLPAYFSPLPPSSSSQSPNRDEEPAEVEQEAADHYASCSVDLVVPKSSGGLSPSEAKGKSKLHIDDKDRQDKINDHSDGHLPDIEQLIRGKTFSREEIDRLMEVLRSRVVDTEQENQLPSKSGLEEAERAEKPHEKQNPSIDKEDESVEYKWTTTMSHLQPTVQDEIGASPIDIARAYMGSRAKEVGASTGLITKNKKFSPSNSDFSSKPFMPSPLPKAPICWPGAITQDQQGYSTPQTNKSRYGLQSFPRTPYSRTMYTKSKSKLTPFQGDSERFPNVSSTPFQPTRSPVHGKLMTNVAEGSYGSGGPIRRMRNQLTSATPSRDSILSDTGHRNPWTKESNVDFMFKRNFEPGSSSTPNIEPVNSKPKNFEASVTSVHPHSSKLARQILEQLDRPITLKEKSEELKLAASWKNSSQAASATSIQSNSSLRITGVGGGKSVVMGDVLDAQKKGENNVLPQNRTNAVSDAGRGVASASLVSLDKTSTISSTNVWSSPSIQKLDSQTKSPDQAIHEKLPKGGSHSLLIGDQTKGLVTTNNSSGSEPQNVQRRPMLSSISINKSGLKTSFASDTSAGFSFPVTTTSSSTFTEPPTPSIMPSSSTSPPKECKISAIPPTFTFGNKITIAPAVNPSVPKFKFGSGKARLSFALAGDDDADSTPNDAATSKYRFGSGEGEDKNAPQSLPYEFGVGE